MDRLAWRSYWGLLLVWVTTVVLWSVLHRGLQAGPVWGVLVPLPLVLAAVDLIVFRRSHEAVCRAHVARHSWLRVVTLGGYPAWAFVATGVCLLPLAAWLGFWVATR